MFRQALSEVRYHPGRFVSTLIAIAISVAFLSGSAVLVATEGQAQGKAMNVPLAQADATIAVTSKHAGAVVASMLPKDPMVAAYSPIYRSTLLVSSGAISSAVELVNLPPEPLRWASLTAGTWPVGPNDVALSAGAAQSLNVGVGQKIQFPGSNDVANVVGLTDEPGGLFTKSGYASDAWFASRGSTPEAASRWAVKAAPGMSADALVADLSTRLASVKSKVTVSTAETYRAKVVSAMAGEFNIFANVLWSFAGVSLIVGMITIANTFTITLAQRRRQIGLLRMVGASGAQMRHRFIAEATILGLLGSVFGLATGIGLGAAVSSWTSSLFWGLALPWTQLAIALALGVVATIAAAFVPIIRGTRVSPIEAIQPIASPDEVRRGSVLRAFICWILFLMGAGLAAFALLRPNNYSLLIAIGGGALIAAAVLFASPLFVPVLLRLVGRVVRLFGVVPRLAADNAERNPRRASATATALMLAIGLMVTLQVATASLRDTGLKELESQYPVDLQVSWVDDSSHIKEIPASVPSRVAAVPGVESTVLLSSVSAQSDTFAFPLVIGYTPKIAEVTGLPDKPADDEILVSPYLIKDLPKTVTMTGSKGKAVLSVRSSRLVDTAQALVGPGTLTRLGKPVPNSVLWASVPDRARAVSVMVDTAKIVGDQKRVGGSIVQASSYEQVLNILLAITTGLLGVAVLIALIGVSNTLSLSVLERKRESALLRALGLQASSLRAMLTVEALQVTVVGIGVGVLAGGFFGWLGVRTAFLSAGFQNMVFSVNVPQTLAMIGIALLAAALASVLPGRRAAKTAPTEALAEV